MAKGGGASKPGVFTRLSEYLRGVRQEMKRVVWPDRPEILNSSLIVVTTLIVFVFFVLIIDQAASFLIIDQLAQLGR